MDTPDTNPTEPIPPDPPPEPPPEPERRLTRSRQERVLGGVCGGLGRYFSIDPVIFRIATVALIFVGGAGLVLYLAAWLLVPEEGAGPLNQDRRRRALTLVGAALLVVGAAAALSHGPFGWWPWPFGLVLLAGLGVWAVSAAGGASPTDGARRAGRVMAVVIACILLAVGGAWLAGVGGATVAGVAIVVLGLVIAGVGAAGWGVRWLIAPALSLALPAAAVAAAGVDLHGGIGNRTEHPTSLAQVQDSYRLGAGRLVIDLRDAHLVPGPRSLEVRMGAGEAVVLVGDDVCVSTHATVGAGQADSFDRGSGGLDVDWTDAPSSPAGQPRLLLDADIGVGHLAVAHRLSDVDQRRFRHGYGERVTGEGNTGCEGSRAP